MRRWRRPVLSTWPDALRRRVLGALLTTHDAVREPFVGSTRLRLAGLALHAYTASGTVLALLIVIAAIDGDAVRALWLVWPRW